jgi:amidohydrolase
MLTTDAIEEAITWRRDFHQHPETAFKEHRTSRLIAERLAAWGLAVRTGYGGTGVVGTLSRGTSSRTIAIRADIDALPIMEDTGIDHASLTPGAMHACGHDGHTAMLLAAAKHCARHAEIDGTVHFVFQPAEENEAGARKMIEDGLFRDIRPDAVYALHNWPGLAVGSCIARDGAMMAAFGTFEIVIRGRGSHAAMPHEGFDPIMTSCQVVSALQTVSSRAVSPLEAVVVSATQIHAGDTWNVIPDSCVIRGTTRWFSDTVGQTIERRLTAIADHVAQAFGCEAVLTHQVRYPTTINSPTEANFVREVAKDHALGMTFIDGAPSMAAEDFAFMLREKPGCYFWLGAGKEGDNPGLHSPRYDFNDAILATGANFWIALTKQALAHT